MKKQMILCCLLAFASCNGASSSKPAWMTPVALKEGVVARTTLEEKLAHAKVERAKLEREVEAQSPTGVAGLPSYCNKELYDIWTAGGSTSKHAGAELWRRISGTQGSKLYEIATRDKSFYCQWVRACLVERIQRASLHDLYAAALKGGSQYHLWVEAQLKSRIFAMDDQTVRALYQSNKASGLGRYIYSLAIKGGTVEGDCRKARRRPTARAALRAFYEGRRKEAEAETQWEREVACSSLPPSVDAAIAGMKPGT